MWIRWTFWCAAVAALSACTAWAPTPFSERKVEAAVAYPSTHNQLREVGWE